MSLKQIKNISKIVFADNAIVRFSRLWGVVIRCSCKDFKRKRKCKHQFAALNLAVLEPNHEHFRKIRQGYEYVGQQHQQTEKINN